MQIVACCGHLCYPLLWCYLPVKKTLLVAERFGDVRGQLERGGEPVDEGYFERWLRAKGGVDEAEACIRAHAQWRADYVPMGRILEVGHPALQPQTPAACCFMCESTMMKVRAEFTLHDCRRGRLLTSWQLGSASFRGVTMKGTQSWWCGQRAMTWETGT